MGTSLTAISIRAFFDKVEPRTLAIVVNLLMILAERPDTLTSLQPRGDGFRVPAPLRHSPLQPERSQGNPISLDHFNRDPVVHTWSYKLLLLTGQRREEIGGLRWSEIDFATHAAA